MPNRAIFYRDEMLPCGHEAARFSHTRVLRASHAAGSRTTPIICPICGSSVRARCVRSH